MREEAQLKLTHKSSKPIFRSGNIVILEHDFELAVGRRKDLLNKRGFTLNFVRADVAAKYVDYSQGYLSRLARENKVNAFQKTRNSPWFYNLDSLKDYARARGRLINNSLSNV